MEKIDLLICNFLPNNFLRFMIFQKNRHTASGSAVSYLETFLS